MTTKKCVVCGKEFICYNKPGNFAKCKAKRRSNSITCSKLHSKYYASAKRYFDEKDENK